jgi:hypothetical protein
VFGCGFCIKLEVIAGNTIHLDLQIDWIVLGLGDLGSCRPRIPPVGPHAVCAVDAPVHRNSSDALEPLSTSGRALPLGPRTSHPHQWLHRWPEHPGLTPRPALPLVIRHHTAPEQLPRADPTHTRAQYPPQPRPDPLAHMPPKRGGSSRRPPPTSPTQYLVKTAASHAKRRCSSKRGLFAFPSGLVVRTHVAREMELAYS